MGEEAPVGVKEGADTGSSVVSRFVSAVAPLLLLASLAALPLVGPGPNTIRLLFVTLTLVTASVGWNLLGGFAGQISFGFAVSTEWALTLRRSQSTVASRLPSPSYWARLWLRWRRS